MANSTAAIARTFAKVDRLEAELRQARAARDEAVRAYSYSKGFCVPLRVESVRREILSGAGA